VGGAVVAAAAAVLAVVVAAPAQPVRPGPSAPQAAPPAAPSEELSGRQVLLLAADVAQAQPDGTGDYWHVEERLELVDSPLERYNTWTSRDGVRYYMPDGYSGAYRLVEDGEGFFVGGSLLTLAQLRGLPTDPDELRAWMADSYRTPDERGGGMAEEELPAVVPDGLSRLLWQVPAPAEVRSAALRALAGLPNVTNLGAVDGGLSLRVVFASPQADKFPNGELPPGTGEMTLVIDPDTATLVSTTTYQGTTGVLAAGWTDDLPEILPPR
jgi:hypothetical protein